MEMSKPAGLNRIDENDHGWIGKAQPRIDGHLKVRGAARYAYEVQADQAVYGWLLGASIAKGRITLLDTEAAERVPGVLLVMTHLNAPKQAPFALTDPAKRFARAKPYLGTDRVRFYGEPVALVVAQTLEQARAAARLVHIEYAEEQGQFELKQHLHDGVTPPSMNGTAPDAQSGDFATAFKEATVQLDVTYTTPVQIHAQMEPHASLAYWQGEHLTVHCSAQTLVPAQHCLADTLAIAPEQVRVLSPYVGGGFGGKLPIYADAILAALAAKVLQRPVKLALTRQQMFHITSHRSDTVQRLRLGADAEGHLTAIGHDNWSHSARYDNYFESSGFQTRNLYAADNRLIQHRRVALDLPESNSLRAPGEGVGMLALECAMDELAVKLKLDPVELRKRNEPTQDPLLKVPFSARHLVACMDEGAQRFGWSARNPEPGQVREGEWLVGMGMSASSRGNVLQKAQCGLRITPQGRAEVSTSMTDIGTGTYTIVAQVTAEMFGLALEQIDVQLADSDLPPGSGSGGSYGAASTTSSLYDACVQMQQKIADHLMVPVAQLEFSQGKVNGVSLALIASQTSLDVVGSIAPGSMKKDYSQQGYGAFFAEVAVNRFTGEVRVRRMLGVFAAGRILNMQTALSQATGGMIWGISAALHEEAMIDPQFGEFANQDLANYHIPSHADVPNLEAVYLPELDDKANPLKIKGVGELGICGAGACIANAVYNACGVRVRDYPLSLDKLLEYISIS